MYNKCLHITCNEVAYNANPVRVLQQCNEAGNLLHIPILLSSIATSCCAYWRISIITSTDPCVSKPLCWPLWEWWTGRSQSGAGLTEFSVRGHTWGLLHEGVIAAFLLGSSFNETRHIGQVVCFCNHKSKQERWKLCRHVGMILRSSFSVYSLRHMEHWASSFEYNSSEYFIIGIAAITKGSNPQWASST